MRKNTFRVNARENEVLLWSGQCTTNSTSDPDGLSDTVLSVTRTAAGKFTVLLDAELRCPQILYPQVSLVGAAGYDTYFTSLDKDAQATSTITCDTKANTTDDDYFTLHDGYRAWTVVLDVNGTGDTTGLGDIVVDVSGATTAADISALLYTDLAAAAIGMTPVDATGSVTLTQTVTGNKGNVSQQGTQVLSNAWAVTDMTGGIDGVYGFKFETWAKEAVDVAATGTVIFDTKANTTTGDYFILNDGHRIYGFELNTTTTTTLHHIAPVEATGTLVCGTGDQSANDGDYFILNDGQERYCFELDKDAGGATLVLGGTVDYGNSITAVNTSGSPSAIATAALMKTAIDSTSIQMTVVDNGDATLTLTNEGAGAAGNTQQVEAVSNAAYTITDMTGGYEVDVVADVWTVIDVSAATTAAQVGTAVLAIVNGTSIQITAADAGTPSGTLTLTNDGAGPHGNTQQQLSETGSTLLALTDMTGGLAGAANVAADTTDYDVYMLLEMRNSKRDFR